MDTPHSDFAAVLVQDLQQESRKLLPDSACPTAVLSTRSDGQVVRLDLTPFEAQPQPCDAQHYFASVRDATDLFSAYDAAKAAVHWEWQHPKAAASVHPYAEQFLSQLLSAARASLTGPEAVRIAALVAGLDVYAAVKTVESLLNGPVDRLLLQLAEQHGWSVILDHLAIRCGSEANDAAHRVAQLLCKDFAYCAPQLAEEVSYRFDDGWNAYPLYKILENGQVIRLFVDESSRGHARQIIQHWNYVYGFTPHHMALRAIRPTPQGWQAVPLAEIIQHFAAHGASTMTPTGDYTEGLLEQVFTQPSHTPDIPASILERLTELGGDHDLSTIIRNGKLTELVSRREMKPAFAEMFFGLYGIEYRPTDPCQSAPLYPYFLPAQAAHVIRSSIQAGNALH